MKATQVKTETNIPHHTPCLVCSKAMKAPYARVQGALGVCSKACESVWKKRVEDSRHPQGG